MKDPEPADPVSQPAGQPDPVQAMMASDAAARMLGIEVTGHGDGWARARMTVTGDMVNGHGTCHGGIIFALADTVFACACNSRGPVTVAAGGDISFVAPGRAGDVLVAEGRERAVYGRNGIYDVTVTRDGDLVAEFRGRSREVGRKALPADEGVTRGPGGRRTRARRPRPPLPSRRPPPPGAGTTPRPS